MEWYHVGLGLLLVLFIGLGLSIPFALAAASMPFLFYIQGWSTALVSSELKLWGVWIDYVLLAVPLFVLLGELIGRSTIGPNLYRFMHRGVRVRGSAAYGSIAACAGFGAVCGSSMVGSLTIGGVALPEMQKLGYDNRLSSGALAAGGTLSVLIPPSLILLFFGIVTDTSIGDLFIAGIIPGIVLVALFCVVVYVWGRMRPAHIPTVDESARSSPREMLTSVGPIFVIGLVITLSIYTGIATPTEAAAVAALLTVILAFAVGGLDPARFKDALVLEMVHQAPARVQRLVLYATGAQGSIPTRFETMARSRERLVEEGFEAVARRTCATWLLRREASPAYPALAALALRAHLQSAQAGLHAMEGWDGRERLAGIACPTLVVWGEHDRSYGWPLVEQLWRTIPGASLAVLPTCSHALHLERPALFHALVQEFLQPPAAIPG